MQTAITTIRTTLIAIMTLAQYHDSLAEEASVGIILANEGLKENIATHTIFPISFVLFLLAYTSALDYQDISWKPILLPMLVLSIYTRNSPYPSTLKTT